VETFSKIATNRATIEGRKENMKTSNPLKRPHGLAAFSRIRHVRYLGWEDAFDVEFEDGLCFLEPNTSIRKSNSIQPHAVPIGVFVDPELGSHFIVTYDDGSQARVSWSFIREYPHAVEKEHRRP
jgi:hypothetical protein